MTRSKRWLLGVAVGAVGLLSATAARAQYPGQLYGPAGLPGPAVSPYLSLSRSFGGIGTGFGGFGGSPALNYFGYVRPQLAFRNSLYGLQSQVSGLAGAVDQGGFADPYGLYGTGHLIRFNNLSHYYYYPLTGVGGVGGRGGAGFGGRGGAIGALGGRGGFGGGGAFGGGGGLGGGGFGGGGFGGGGGLGAAGAVRPGGGRGGR